MLLSIVIPVFNEVNTIEIILQRVMSAPGDKEVIIIDDCSTDGTQEKLKAFTNQKIKIFYHEENKGKGAALQTGFAHVTGDIVIIQDGDLEYNPSEYPLLIQPILEGKADVVYGSRFLGGPHRVLFFWHYVGNTFLTLLSNMLTNINLTDMETCYKVFKADLLKKITLQSNRFGIEPELTAKFAKLNCKIYEVPISYNGRDYSEGKKIGWKDGVSALYCILKFNIF